MKEEGWYLLLGSKGADELLALKRVGIPVGQKSSCTLIFPALDSAGRTITEVTLFLLSDSYQGMDQEYTVCFFPQ